MNDAVKQKWVEALRSGKYRQAKQRLHLEDGSMCCLGVLCDLYIKEHPNAEWEKREHAKIDVDGKQLACYELFQDSSILPYTVSTWAGLKNNSHNPYVNYKGKSKVLTEMNDKLDCDFNTIADAIEESL